MLLGFLHDCDLGLLGRRRRIRLGPVVEPQGSSRSMLESGGEAQSCEIIVAVEGTKSGD